MSVFSRPRRRAIMAGAILACLPLFGGAWLWHRRPAPRAMAPMTHGAYLWQRSWDAPTRQAVETQRVAFGEILVLGAEIRWTKDGAHTDWPAVDGSAFGGRPVGAVLRAGPLPGRKLAQSPAQLERIRADLRRLLDRLEAAGVQVAEAQLDFDAATSQLADYAAWLRTIKADLAVRCKPGQAPLPLTVTTLPSWLSSRSFAEVAQVADGFVLQVHSLERPRDGKPAPTLCEAARAKAWIEAAGRLRRPFRVALPTCGYAAAYDAQGKFLGACAEGATPPWPAGARVEKILPDPAEMAGLVRLLAADRPTDLEGLLWFRLPVAGDQRNWRSATLLRVMRGEAPQARPQAQLVRDASGARDVALANAGDGPCPARLRLRVHPAAGAQVAAGDAVAGWTMEHDGQGGVAFTPPANFKAHDLGAGDRLPVGWLRLDPVDAKVTSDVEAMD